MLDAQPDLPGYELASVGLDDLAVAGVPRRIYLTGGATAVLEGWPGSTIDVDLRLEPSL